MFTDIHNHCIYGVDDGARTFERTCFLLREAVKDGIHAIISTPHVTPGQEEFDYDLYLRHFEKARSWIAEEQLGLQLYTGSEILYTPYTARLLRENKVMTMNGTRNVLVEFAPSDSYSTILDAAATLGNAGYQVIFAHIERYIALKKLNQLYELQEDYNVRLQVNGRTLLRKAPLLRRKYMEGMFKEGLIDFVACDTHDFEGRGTCMTSAYNALKELVSEEYAINLTEANPQRLLQEKYYTRQ